MATKLIHTEIDGLKELISEPYKDGRGEFLNLFKINDQNYSQIWGDRKVCQINKSITLKKGTIRGLHLQKSPHQEFKIIRCIKGKVWDVGIDLRKNSKTYLKWHAIKLDPLNNNAIIIPEGCAHGFQTLEDDSELVYIHSKNWIPEYEFGIRFDDPKLKIPWPLNNVYLSERDKNLPFI